MDTSPRGGVSVLVDEGGVLVIADSPVTLVDADECLWLIARLGWASVEWDRLYGL